MKQTRLIMVGGFLGAGKTTLKDLVIKDFPDIKYSISATTRAPREGEVDGVHYFFKTKEEFEKLIKEDGLIEWNEVHGNYYGTSRIWIERQMAQGNDVLLEIDWQGARQVRRCFEGTVGIFILPPSIEALEWRLHHRGTDSEQTITRRLLGAGAEMAHAPEFEYVIINEDFETALSQMQAVVVASRLAFRQQAVRHRDQFVNLGIPL